MEKSKDRNTTARLRSGSCLGCGDQIKSPGVWPASDLLFTDQTKISVQFLFQRNDLRDWSLFIFWRGGGGRILGAHHRFFGKLTANKLPMWGGGLIKRFQSLSGDQVNFMVTIRILRPPTGSCIFLSLQNLLVLINSKVHSISCCYLY